MICHFDKFIKQFVKKVIKWEKSFKSIIFFKNIFNNFISKLNRFDIINTKINPKFIFLYLK
jgi:hypothetical protein